MNSKLERCLEKAADELPAIPAIAEQVAKAVNDPNISPRGPSPNLPAEEAEPILELCRQKIKNSQAFIS